MANFIMGFEKWSEEELVDLINNAESVLKEKRRIRRIVEKKDRIRRMCAEFRDRINGMTIKQLARKYDMSTSAMRSDTDKVLRIIKHDHRNLYDIDGNEFETGPAGFDYFHKNDDMRSKILECVDNYEERRLKAI